MKLAVIVMMTAGMFCTITETRKKVGQMTESEIIKALECIASKENVLCDSCPNKKLHLLECHRQGAKNALDLINRQKAEIYELQHKILNCNSEIERLKEENHHFADLGKMYSEIKAEAIKEFAERLKENTIDVDVSYGYGREHYTEAVAVIEIDNLVKEKAGEKYEL